MKTYKLSLALLAATLLLPGWLRAQQIFTAPLTVNGTTPAKLEFRADGTLISTGQDTRLQWYPAKGAFRAIGFEGYPEVWNDAYIGAYSVAFGEGTWASGPASTALGSYTSSGGYASVAMGYSSYALGNYSISMGMSAIASAECSVAIGNDVAATGHHSTAIGYEVGAYGRYSTAIGKGVSSTAYNSFAIGSYNVGGGNATTWVGTDPLFEIGNGTSWEAKSSALIVYKNGNIKIPKPQGDIPMGEFQ